MRAEPYNRSSIIPTSMGWLLGYGIIVLALLITLGVNLYTLTQVVRARTSVPYRDQWVVVQELTQYEHGEAIWPILWSPFWGHRLVIPRLLFLADGRWFSLNSMTWLTVLLQSVHVSLLIALAWLLLGRRSFALFMSACAVILNLMFSPFQMENFVWGIQTMFPLVFAAASGAFVCLSLGGGRKRGLFLALSIAFGIVATYTMPNGTLVWLVLVVQAIYLKQNQKVITILAVIGTVVIASYLWDYRRPLELGMGVGGIVRHPVDSIMLLGLVFG